jgi:hypothetical protein
VNGTFFGFKHRTDARCVNAAIGKRFCVTTSLGRLQIKTPPVTEVAGGVFEPIFPVDFSFLRYLLAGPTRILSTRSAAVRLFPAQWSNAGTKPYQRF